jgi:hypothetical protein
MVPARRGSRARGWILRFRTWIGLRRFHQSAFAFLACGRAQAVVGNDSSSGHLFGPYDVFTPGPPPVVNMATSGRWCGTLMI